MPNILINPNSGILEFNTGTTGSSSLDASLSGAVRLVFSNSGTLGIQSYSTGVVDKFFVEGVNGRLFEVDDLMTGSLMSVNDIAGLPILEVFSDDRVVMGQYNSNTLHVSGDFIGVDCLPVSGISLNVSGVSRFNTTGLVISGDSISASGKLSLSSGTTGRATFNIPHGIAPTSPVDGDIWTTISGLYARINGATVNTNSPTNLWIPASQWIPRTTTGCGVDSRETTTNFQNFDELLFDAATNEFAQALVRMPSNYNNSAVTARFYWTASTGSGAVVWGLQGRAFADDDALDSATGIAQTVTDTLIAINDMHISPATSNITITGVPAATTPIQFQLYRDAVNAADTLAVDARLLGVEILYSSI